MRPRGELSPAWHADLALLRGGARRLIAQCGHLERNAAAGKEDRFRTFVIAGIAERLQAIAARMERRRQREKKRETPWHWAPLGPGHLQFLDGHDRNRCTLFHQHGVPGVTWHTWDRHGVGGENDVAQTLEEAKEQATAAAARQWPDEFVPERVITAAGEP